MHANNQRVLLICSVGGTPEPIAAAIRHWRPARLVFLSSEQTRASIKTALDALTAAGDPTIPPGCTDQTLLRDPQDLQQTLGDLRPLDQHVRSWQQRGEGYDVVVDFTGGTKVMSAALALVARRWKCTFAYVGGQERNRNGVGVVVSGRETQFSQFNPWDALGYQAVEEAVAVFNHGGYAAAAALLDQAVRGADDAAVKRELSTLKAVIDAYAAWDRFDHKEAAQRFADALKNRNDLFALFPHEYPSLIARLERHRDHVRGLSPGNEPKLEWVIDLVQNARRRSAEQRLDDAVARLYRAIEALAQVVLREKHGILNTRAVTLDQLPQTLRDEWASRARDGRTFMLGLQDAYRVLRELADPVGQCFDDARLAAAEGSPLVARNNSILAHGFQPVGENAYKQLHDAAKRLLQALGADVPEDTGEVDSWSLPAPGRRLGPSAGAG